MRLANKIAIVTGGASGFGLGIVKKFLTEGAKVIIADINAENGQQAIVALQENTLDINHKDNIHFIATDVSQADSVKALIDSTINHFGGLDIIVNNAGMGHTPRPLEDVTEDLFDNLIAVNVKSVYLTAKYATPHFKAQQSGTILNVASTGAVSPRPHLTWYNMTKGAMNTATKGMAVELAPHNIRVNALNPVAGETPMVATFMGEDTPEMRAKFLSTIPLGRFSTPEDMGNAACYLCSDEASMVTGICLEVDGGRCI